MNLYGSDKYDRSMQRKPFGPGKNIKFRASRPSEYARQLLEKQRAREIYGLSESQFRRLYEEATEVTGQTGDTMKRFLEQRLDNAIYRAGLAMTRLQARQFASHGLFLVDGQRVTIPSMRLRVGQKITVRAQVKDSPVFMGIIEQHGKHVAPNWLKADAASRSFEVVTLPGPEHAEQAVDMRQVIEFYSRN
jgi:small subunit ribosomal protein S4